MKRCPSCNRTYADDTMTNCAHDGAPLAPAAYSPHGEPAIPPPQAYAPQPPPPQGYPPPPPPYQQGYPQQNYPPQYPPPGYPPQAYPPPTQIGEYVSCPRCMTPGPDRVKFTWWGGALGPKMFDHVRCRTCALEYNGKTGLSNSSKITTYIIVSSVIAFAITLLMIFFVFGR